MLHMVEERAGRNMTARAAETSILRKRPIEEYFSALFGVAGVRIQFSARTKARVGQKINILDIGHQSIEYGGSGFRTGELAYDHVADKVAQRRYPSVMSIGREITRATQARNPYRIENEIV